jgi:hypothetical protein
VLVAIPCLKKASRKALMPSKPTPPLVDLLEAALSYATDFGWPVLPLWWVENGKCACGKANCENPGKHPYGRLAPNGRNSATTVSETIKKWWTEFPRCNVGVVTGPESGLVVVDVDPRHGGDVSLKKLKTFGNIPYTLTAYTGGDGAHYYLAHPGNGQIIRSREKMGGFSGVDQKANGGYVVAPPSGHSSGNRYSWKISPYNNAVAPIPAWLLELLLKDEEKPSRVSNHNGVGKIPDGTRNNTLASLAGTMRRRGMTPPEIDAALQIVNQDRCTPRLSKAEVSKIARSIGRYAPEFPAGQTPTPQVSTTSGTVDETSLAKPLEFPEVVMSGAAGRFAYAYSQYLETPPPFLFMNYLTLLGHVVSDNLTLYSELRPQPRLYTVNLGESADDRKSTSIDKTCDFFMEALSLGDVNLLHGVGSAEGLASFFEPPKKEKRGKGNQDFEEPHRTRCVLVLDELKSLVQKCRIDSSVLLPCINTLFEKTSYTSLTKHHKISIDDAQLCLLGASTLDTYRTMFNPTFLDIGFINRLFVVLGTGERKFSIPSPIPQDIKTSLIKDLGHILQHLDTLCLAYGKPFAMRLDSEAMEIFEIWYFEHAGGAEAKRLDTYGHRLLPLMALSEGKEQITGDVAARVVKLLEYELAARKLVAPIDAENMIARVEARIIQALGSGPLEKRNLEKRCHKERVGVWCWNAAISNLITDYQIGVKNNVFSLRK